MRADLTIPAAPWMLWPETRAVMTALNHDDVNALFVGGCIRNELMKADVKDIDIACKFTPETTIKILNAAYIKTIPTGIKYGTITAIINDISFEITSLRSDNNTDGRHADVSYGANWIDDAKRRDFTINALYADMDGKIYDPLGTGLNDIQEKNIRFIGDANERITEDYLRILRFFRFYGRYGNGTPDAASFAACQKFADKINTLSIERIGDELQKIIRDDTAPISLSAMKKANLFDIDDTDIDALPTLISLQNQLDIPNIHARLYLFSELTKYFNINKLNIFIKQINEFKKWWADTKKIHAALYLFGREICVQGLLILKSTGHTISDTQIADAISNPVPTFPVTATDIMDYFKISEGPDVGRKLKAAEKLWLSNPYIKTMDILNQI